MSMDKTYGAYAIIAVQRAIEDAGLTPDQIDGLMVCPDAAGDSWRAEDRGEPRPYFAPPYDSEDGLTIVTCDWLIKGMKREGTPLRNLKYIDNESSSIGQMTGKAAQVVGNGQAKNLVMVYGMGNVPGRYKLEEGDYSRGGRKWSAPWGWMTSAMMQHGFVFLQYCTKYGGSHDNLAPFVINQRRNGLMTPWGYYAQHEQYQITLEDYLTQRYVAWPNGLLDSDRPVNHVAAFLFTTAERAKDMKRKPIYVLNHVQASHPSRSTMATLEDHEEWTDSLARRLYEGAGATASDLDIFNPYDGFATFTQTYLEAFQWHGVKRGEAFDFYAGDIRVEGPHPFNSSGGNLGNGRTRTAMYTDSIEQLRGTAGPRQIRLKAETAACGQVTPGGNGHIFLSVHPS
jgi:acetyl-CoA acetyltransferase